MSILWYISALTTLQGSNDWNIIIIINVMETETYQSSWNIEGLNILLVVYVNRKQKIEWVNGMLSSRWASK